MKKTKGNVGSRVEEGRVMFLKFQVVRKDLSDEMTFKQRPE